MRAITSLTVLAALAAMPCLSAAPASAAASSALCIGHLKARPASVRVGGIITLIGDHFSCKTPTNQMFHAAVILYRPHLGFTIFTSAVSANGTYRITARMPKMLTAESMLNGGKDLLVAAKPGVYYLTVRLSDVYLPPPAQALAHLTVTG